MNNRGPASFYAGFFVGIIHIREKVLEGFGESFNGIRIQTDGIEYLQRK